MAKAVPKDKPNTPELSFEQAVARLEEIVEAMQSPDLPLDQIIERYEEGMKLMALCGEKLEAAEQKIELLTREKSGKFKKQPFSASLKPDSGTEADDEEEDTPGEARLF
jgi:exodeoxyribonuclease VII small subunit